MLTKIKPEYSNILYNQTRFLSPLMCQIRQVSLYNQTHFNFGSEVCNQINEYTLDGGKTVNYNF
jgi:hypothetical protein